MRGRFWAVLVALACFGPYVASGVRSEQVVVYGLAVLAVMTSAVRMWLPGRMLAASVVWLLLAAMAAVGTLTVRERPGGDPIAGLDALLLPLAVLVVVAAIPTERRFAALQAVATIVVMAGAANAGISWLQSTGQMPVGLADWLPIGDQASGARAALQGRYTGIMNQPALAGCFYSLALLLASWRIRGRPLLAGAWALLCFGGVLSGSKAFLYVGLPVALLYLILARTGRGLFVSTILAGMVTAVVAFAVGALGEGIVGQVTGNRYGDQGAGGNVLRLASESIQLDPLGHGLGGLPRSTDSQWLQVIDFAGVPGAVAFAVVLGLLWWSAWRAVEPSARALCIAVVVLTVAASFAFPLLTGNRVAPLFWMVLALGVSATAPAEIASKRPRSLRKREAREDRGRAVHRRKVERLTTG